MTSSGIKSLRIELDRITSAISMYNPTRELALSITNIENARMWLGEALAESGYSTPYADSLDPTNEKIAPESDSFSGAFDWTSEDGSKIKFFKELRATLVDKGELVRQELIGGSKSRFYQNALSQAYHYITNARMWLGKELNRIKDENSEETSESPE